MKDAHSGEFSLSLNGASLRFARTRTFEQTQKTKHIDKLRRAILEAIQAKYGDVPEKMLKEKVETGINEGGVAWIGDVRVAEMRVKPGGGDVKGFTIDASKITGDQEARVGY